MEPRIKGRLLFFGGVLLMGWVLPPLSLSAAMDRRANLWETVEWTVENPGVEGNKFELEAEVTFRHAGSDRERVTPMFYKGDGIWAWRFTGTQTGDWRFETESSDARLDGLSGRIEVSESGGEKLYGFTRAAGTRWARQSGPAGELDAFVPQWVMYESSPRAYYQKPEKIRDDIETFIEEHGFTGFHVPTVGGYWFDLESGAGHGGTTVSEERVNPDPRTFEALEGLIRAVHQAGGTVHIWAWGDQQRGQTPINLPGGINGERDRRLQRYIAARLGPLPGWTMGYGFDLNEWVGAPEDPSRVNAWCRYIHRHSGWKHLLGGRPVGPNDGTDHGDNVSWNRALDYASYEHHEPTYEVYVAALTAEVGGEPLGKPVLSEDRFRIRGLEGPGKDYTERQTRRGLWISTMAGGVANIWGNLTTEEGEAKGGGISYPYPHAYWIKTYDRFFFERDRFTLSLKRANGLVSGDSSLALAEDSGNRIVVYAEASDRIRLDLSRYDVPFRVTAIDTTKPYKEIDAGTLEPGENQVWKAPAGRTSDWALALNVKP